MVSERQILATYKAVKGGGVNRRYIMRVSNDLGKIIRDVESNNFSADNVYRFMRTLQSLSQDFPPPQDLQQGRQEVELKRRIKQLTQESRRLKTSNPNTRRWLLFAKSVYKLLVQRSMSM